MRLTKILMALGLIFLLAPLGQWGTMYLENYYPRLSHIPSDAKGIILLGGNFDLQVSHERGIPCYNLAAGRLVGFMEIAAQYPNLPVVFTGGGIRGPQIESEAEWTRHVLEKLRFDLTRVRFEDQSLNTYENAKLTFEMIRPQPEDRWVLVTSAVHMPRSIALFRAFGWNVIPCPVDYHAESNVGYRLQFNALKIIQYCFYAFHEWGGLVEVYIRGNSQTLLPARS